MTEAQEKAKRAVQAAADAIIAEIEEDTSRHNCTEFHALFHLQCYSTTEGKMYGQPATFQLNRPIFKSAFVR